MCLEDSAALFKGMLAITMAFSCFWRYRSSSNGNRKGSASDRDAEVLLRKTKIVATVLFVLVDGIEYVFEYRTIACFIHCKTEQRKQVLRI